MKTIYKTIKLTNDNKLIINKKNVMNIDITSDMFKNGVINQLKELLTKEKFGNLAINKIEAKVSKGLSWTLIGEVYEK